MHPEKKKQLPFTAFTFSNFSFKSEIGYSKISLNWYWRQHYKLIYNCFPSENIHSRICFTLKVLVSGELLFTSHFHRSWSFNIFFSYTMNSNVKKRRWTERKYSKNTERKFFYDTLKKIRKTLSKLKAEDVQNIVNNNN